MTYKNLSLGLNPMWEGVFCISVSKRKFKHSDLVGGHRTCAWDLFGWNIGQLGGSVEEDTMFFSREVCGTVKC